MEYLSAFRRDATTIEFEGLKIAPALEPCGVWVNDTNGHTRLALTRDGRYNKTQGLRQNTYSGRYSCQGAQIRFIDDFDFVLTGEITGNILRIGEYVYRRL